MMAKVVDFIKATLEASILLSPRNHGLEPDTIRKIALQAGFRPGEVNDAIKDLLRQARDSGPCLRIDHLPGRRLDSDFNFASEPEFRKLEAFQFVRNKLKESRQELGRKNAGLSRDELVSLGQTQRLSALEVDAAVTLMVMDEILTEEGEIIREASGKEDWPTPFTQAEDRGLQFPVRANTLLDRAIPLVRSHLNEGENNPVRGAKPVPPQSLVQTNPPGQFSKKSRIRLSELFAKAQMPDFFINKGDGTFPTRKAPSLFLEVNSILRGEEGLDLSQLGIKDLPTGAYSLPEDVLEHVFVAVSKYLASLENTVYRTVQKMEQAEFEHSLNAILEAEGVGLRCIGAALVPATSQSPRQPENTVKPFVETTPQANSPLPTMQEDIDQLLERLYQWEQEREAQNLRHGDFNSESVAKILGWTASRFNRIVAALKEEGLLKCSLRMATKPFDTYGIELTPKGWSAAEQRSNPKKDDDNSQPDTGKYPMEEPTEKFDLVIVCALKDPELKRVRKTGKAPWKEFRLPNDPQDYYRTTYVTLEGKSLSVVAAAPNQMGLSSSAVLASKMILKFHPGLVAMVGIAAGARKDKQEFGDILVAEHTFDYGSGKLVLDKDGKLTLQADPKPFTVGATMRQRLLAWAGQEKASELHEIFLKWDADAPGRSVKVHLGPLASGAAVLDTRGPIEEVERRWRKLVGVEMEAYAVHCACQEARSPVPEYLCAKSICDFAEDKKDHWQSFAAFTAAEFCHQFLIEEWEKLVPENPR
jgi:nucleoside phosphorylase